MKKFQMISRGFIILFVFGPSMDARACSVFQVTAQNGTIISDRTMEFGCQGTGGRIKIVA